MIDCDSSHGGHHLQYLLDNLHGGPSPTSGDSLADAHLDTAHDGHGLGAPLQLHKRRDVAARSVLSFQRAIELVHNGSTPRTNMQNFDDPMVLNYRRKTKATARNGKMQDNFPPPTGPQLSPLKQNNTKLKTRESSQSLADRGDCALVRRGVGRVTQILHQHVKALRIFDNRQKGLAVMPCHWNLWVTCI